MSLSKSLSSTKVLMKGNANMKDLDTMVGELSIKKINQKHAALLKDLLGKAIDLKEEEQEIFDQEQLDQKIR